MNIRSKIKDYKVEMINGALDKKKKLFAGLKYSRLFYFLDEKVYGLYEIRMKKFIGGDFKLLIQATERNKSYIKLADYYRALMRGGFTRDDILVVFGGGVLQDISGFIASTLYRGIRWVFFPTTLLAEADSCIGSKTSINFDDVKNLIGTFCPPDLIYIDMEFCKTLGKEQFNSGLGEIIKFHLMADEKRYRLLKQYLASPDLKEGHLFKKIILSTLDIKKSYFEKDEFDSGRRNLLNYGHCYGHAVESASNFGISHGEAVLLGMGIANLISLERGIMPKALYEDLEAVLYGYYPNFDLTRLPVTKIIGFLKKDKKRTGRDLTMILAKGIGRQVKCGDIKESELINAHKKFLKKYYNAG